MADDLYVEKGQDDNLWVCSRQHGTAIAVCRQVCGQWFAAEDDSFSGEVGPFNSLDDLVNAIESRRLFEPWFGIGL